jgi:hypothetical protein
VDEFFAQLSPFLHRRNDEPFAGWQPAIQQLSKLRYEEEIAWSPYPKIRTVK